MHKSLVFLSCGQIAEEKDFAKELERMIRDGLNMDCYNADSVHGFDDVMSITDKLAIADYYVMIDFKRGGCPPLSVFTHQEFALARAWGLDKMLVFQEEGLDSHGMLSYVLAHPTKFTRDKLVEIVKAEILKEKWAPNYSRNLVASKIDGPKGPFNYVDHTGQYFQYSWYLTVNNFRKDKAAVNTVVILNSITNCTTGEKIDFPDRSPLKWVGSLQAYEQTILPEDHASFDAFAVHANENGIFLLSRQDTTPREPVVSDIGEYDFIYHVYAHGFPLLKIRVRINYTGSFAYDVNVGKTVTTAQISRQNPVFCP